MDWAFERAVEHQHTLLMRQARRVVDLPFGFVALTENDLGADASATGTAVVQTSVDADTLLDACAPLFFEAGVGSGVITLADAAVADHVEAGLSAAGYDRSDELVMAYLGPSTKPPTVRADRVSFDEVRPRIEDAWRRAGRSEETARALTERLRRSSEVCDLFHFAVRDAGESPSGCDLFVLGPSAQIGGVMTHPSWEGRGHATACVSAAVSYALGRGCDLVFLVTDADDWPQRLYQRLGFVEVGRLQSFERAEKLRVVPVV